MSKIICDVCGTSYPETATQCPICGCVRSADAHVVAGDTNDPQPKQENTYVYVKGGRFSKSNVKKRNSMQNISSTQEESVEGGKDNSNVTGLIIVVVALLAAIIAVAVYIYFQFFGPGAMGNTGVLNNPTTESSTVETTVLDVPCVVVTVDKDELTLSNETTTSYKLTTTILPLNSTDALVFRSADESIATVDGDGLVTAVGTGETTIEITCGAASAEVKVVCSVVPEETTEPVTVPQYSTDDFKFKKTDITMGEKGQVFTLYNGEIPADQITWTTDNEKVAVIDSGVVTATGKGTTNVYAEYADVKLTCVVRCAPTVGTYSESAVPTGTHLSSTDVTLHLSSDKSFTLNLLSKDGAVIECEWVIANSQICSITDNLVEALAVGNTTISTTYEDATYKCVVRVAQ